MQPWYVLLWLTHWCRFSDLTDESSSIDGGSLRDSLAARHVQVRPTYSRLRWVPLYYRDFARSRGVYRADEIKSAGCSTQVLKEYETERARTTIAAR